MLNSLKILFSLLPLKDQRRGIGLLLLYIPCAVVEAAGVASILPFMVVASQPELLASSAVPPILREWLIGLDPKQALLFLGLAVLAILIISNALSATAIWLTLRYCWRQHHEFSTRLLQKYLAMPYAYFFKSDTTTLIKNIVSESQQAVENFLFPFAEFVAKAIVAITVFALLIAIDPALSLIVAVVMGGIYTIVYYIIRKRLAIVGHQRILSNEERYKYVTEAFGGLKEVKTLLAEKFFERQFAKPSKNFCKQMTRIGLLSRLPRYFIEMVAFGSIILIVLYVLYVRGDFSQVIPVLSLYAFAAYRVLPSLQQMFLNLSRMRIHEGVVHLLAEDLKPMSEEKKKEAYPLLFQREIFLENISYTYESENTPVLENIHLQITKNQCVGFVGRTGCGKTTLLDILIGLLSPTGGSLKVDGVEINENNIKNWFRCIGYVPQDIFLIDDTIRRNIALGVDDQQIDPRRLEQAARLANLHEFVERELEDGYNTIVGERGIRLSGGQRQRIGIARALYHDPDVVIFDEATNALDGLTEERVMEAIRNLAHRKTLLIVAHRLSTLRECDVIYVLDEGGIVDRGAYNELKNKSEYFKRASTLA